MRILQRYIAIFTCLIQAAPAAAGILTPDIAEQKPYISPLATNLQLYKKINPAQSDLDMLKTYGILAAKQKSNNSQYNNDYSQYNIFVLQKPLNAAYNDIPLINNMLPASSSQPQRVVMPEKGATPIKKVRKKFELKLRPSCIRDRLHQTEGIVSQTPPEDTNRMLEEPSNANTSDACNVEASIKSQRETRGHLCDEHQEPVKTVPAAIRKTVFHALQNVAPEETRIVLHKDAHKPRHNPLQFQANGHANSSQHTQYPGSSTHPAAPKTGPSTALNDLVYTPLTGVANNPKQQEKNLTEPCYDYKTNPNTELYQDCESDSDDEGDELYDYKTAGQEIANIIADEPINYDYIPDEEESDMTKSLSLSNMHHTETVTDNGGKQWRAFNRSLDLKPIRERQALPSHLDIKIWEHQPETYKDDKTNKNHIIVGLSHGTFAHETPDINDCKNGAILAPVMTQYAKKANEESRKVIIITLQWSGKNRDQSRRKLAEMKASLYNSLPTNYEIHHIDHSHACNASFVMFEYLKRHIERLICYNPPMRDRYIEKIIHPKQSILRDQNNNSKLGQAVIIASYNDQVVPLGQISTHDIKTIRECLRRYRSRDERMFVPKKPFIGTNTACISIDRDLNLAHSDCKGYLTPHLLEIFQKLDEKFSKTKQSRLEFVTRENKGEILLQERQDKITV